MNYIQAEKVRLSVRTIDGLLLELRDPHNTRHAVLNEIEQEDLATASAFIKQQLGVRP